MYRNTVSIAGLRVLRQLHHPLLCVLTTRPWPIRQQQTGTSSMVSHTLNNNEHENISPCRVITSYERITSCAGTQFRPRASESQGNSATRYYAEYPNHSAQQPENYQLSRIASCYVTYGVVVVFASLFYDIQVSESQYLFKSWVYDLGLRIRVNNAEETQNRMWKLHTIFKPWKADKLFWCMIIRPFSMHENRISFYQNELQ